ncbi:MAG: YeeE/YedE family protein [Methylobacter sp.]|jgi:hypothetical protein|nr:YeeE/YedE family protein [Methylobacter sp.]
MLNINAFFVGLLFGLGLIISGMTDPSKVISFLDLAGAWDPSLAFVMAGAILIGAGAFTIAKKRQRSLLGAPMQLSSATGLDKDLLLGSLIFGIGWGLSGFCPGPAVVSAAAGEPKAWIFVAAMLAGMALFGMIERGGRSD